MGSSSTPKTPHVLIVSYPAQGQINPLLRLAKRLASTGGFLVTFSTTATAGQKIITANGLTDPLYPIGDGFLRFEFFDIGYPCIYNRSQFPEFVSKLELGGRQRVPEMIRRLSEEGRPVSCIVKGDVVPWVSDVAEDLGIPLATLWAQSCASFLTFYHYHNNLVTFPTLERPYADVEIPSLPLLKWDEIHSFLHPSYPVPFMGQLWLREVRNLDKPFCILLDTFDGLEREAIGLAAKLCPAIKPVGPLFKVGPNIADVGADMQKADAECMNWLDTKPPRSVIYVSFGTIVLIKQEQLDEIAHGIMDSGFPFLWVTRAPGLTALLMPDGVPTVVFPQLGDQQTNAKFKVDVFGVAVRMGRGEQEEKVVPRVEVKRCLREATVGPRAEEIRRRAATWKDEADKACDKGGSSDANLRGFVEEIRRRSVNDEQVLVNVD
ncbi:hypothetical protein V2J09_010528 [Rumex salicifolius]